MLLPPPADTTTTTRRRTPWPTTSNGILYNLSTRSSQNQTLAQGWQHHLAVTYKYLYLYRRRSSTSFTSEEFGLLVGFTLRGTHRTHTTHKKYVGVQLVFCIQDP
mmetsp:Transcript_28796/g.67620  ORF Transcript_28796/g.67620 Transcript_28796/m.67620 type:complete len:105 (-) Transcript_28796:74-388(-)